MVDSELSKWVIKTRCIVCGNKCDHYQHRPGLTGAEFHAFSAFRFKKAIP